MFTSENIIGHCRNLNLRYLPYIRPIKGLYKAYIPAKYGLIWYSTSILGSWISHWKYQSSLKWGTPNHSGHGWPEFVHVETTVWWLGDPPWLKTPPHTLTISWKGWSTPPAQNPPIYLFHSGPIWLSVHQIQDRHKNTICTSLSLYV